MNRKIVLSILILGIAIISISSVSAFWPFDSGTDTSINGVNFHIPDGYEEVARNEFTNGEYGDFEKDNWIIEIAVSEGGTFRENENIIAKFDKTVNGKEGTMYVYKTNHMTFVYEENGYLILIRDANDEELEEIII